MMALRPKVECEVCGLEDRKILHRHHIIPRTDPRSTNSDRNLAVLCPNCHGKVHTGELVILGVYDSTGGKVLVWHRHDEPAPFPRECWLVKDNRLVITLGGGTEDDLPEEAEE